jgi:hypothetical protein
MPGPSTSGGQCVLVGWPRSTHGWHSVPIRLANGLGIACHSSRGFIFEPVLVNVFLVVIRWKWGCLHRCDGKQSLHTCPGQRTLFGRTLLSQRGTLGGQFMGQGNVELAAKLSLCASRWSPHWLTEPGPMPKPERCQESVTEARHATLAAEIMAQAGARIFQRNAKAIGSNSNGRRRPSLRFYHLCVEVEDLPCFAVAPVVVFALLLAAEVRTSRSDV